MLILLYFFLLTALFFFFLFNATAPTEIYTLSLHDALPIFAAEILYRYEGPQFPPVFLQNCRIPELTSRRLGGLLPRHSLRHKAIHQQLQMHFHLFAKVVVSLLHIEESA